MPVAQLINFQGKTKKKSAMEKLAEVLSLAKAGTGIIGDISQVANTAKNDAQTRHLLDQIESSEYERGLRPKQEAKLSGEIQNNALQRIKNKKDAGYKITQADWEAAGVLAPEGEQSNGVLPVSYGGVMETQSQQSTNRANLPKDELERLDKAESTLFSRDKINSADWAIKARMANDSLAKLNKGGYQGPTDGGSLNIAEVAKNPQMAPFEAIKQFVGKDTLIDVAESLPFGIGPVAKQVTNRYKDANRQLYDQAVNQMAMATLRKESGATITPAELDQTRRTYFPVPGDSPEVVAQKEQMREAVIAGLEASSSPEALARVRGKIKTANSARGVLPEGYKPKPRGNVVEAATKPR